MYLGTTKGSENIPEDGIQVTREEAIKYQKRIIENWPSQSEVLFLRYGKLFATVVTSVSAAACINVFHPILKLGKGTITAVLPSILIPPAVVYYKTDTVLTDDVLSMKMDCPLCHHFKYLAFQLYGGLAFPSILGILSTTQGHDIPFEKGNASNYWKKSFKVGLQNSKVFNIVLFTQVSVAFFLPYIQKTELENIAKSLSENPEKIDLNNDFNA